MQLFIFFAAGTYLYVRQIQCRYSIAIPETVLFTLSVTSCFGKSLCSICKIFMVELSVVCSHCHKIKESLHIFRINLLVQLFQKF